MSVRVLALTGGHEFDAVAFSDLLAGLDGISAEEVAWPTADLAVAHAPAGGYGALLAYDFGCEFSQPARRGLLRALELGTGLVVLHHAIYNHLAWTVWQQLVGGSWRPEAFEVEGLAYGPSTAVLDQTISVRPSRSGHPITAGLGEFVLHDECYGRCYRAASSQPLLETDHPLSDRVIAWAQVRDGTRTVYLQPGHGPRTFRSPEFRTVLARSLRWVARDLGEAPA